MRPSTSITLHPCSRSLPALIDYLVGVFPLEELGQNHKGGANVFREVVQRPFSLAVCSVLAGLAEGGLEGDGSHEERTLSG